MRNRLVDRRGETQSARAAYRMSSRFPRDARRDRSSRRIARSMLGALIAFDSHS
jgi:hypothetical protein